MGHYSPQYRFPLCAFVLHVLLTPPVFVFLLVPGRQVMSYSVTMCSEQERHGLMLYN